MVTHAWGHQEKRKEKNAKEKQTTNRCKWGKACKKIKEERKGSCTKNQKQGK